MSEFKNEVDIFEEEKVSKLGVLKKYAFIIGIILLIGGGVAMASPVSEFFDRISLENDLSKISEEIGINKGIYSELVKRKAEVHSELKIQKKRVSALEEEWKSIDSQFSELEKKNDVLREKKSLIQQKLGK